MKPPPQLFQVAKPCPKQWEEMAGDAKKRFCEHCQHHVHNVSTMSVREQERFLSESGGKACIVYEANPDGSMFQPPWAARLRHFFRHGLWPVTALAALCLSSPAAPAAEPWARWPRLETRSPAPMPRAASRSA